MDNENCLHLKVEEFEPWAYNKVKSYENIPNLEYWYDTGVIEEKYIPISDIVGTNHYHYGGNPTLELTWADVLLELKHKSYVGKDKLIERICSITPPPRVGQFGNEYYIFDGNNRLCKARFLKLATFYCIVCKYEFCVADFNFSTRLEKLGFSFNYNPNSAKKYDYIEYKDQLFLLADDDVTYIRDFVEAVESIRYNWIDRFIYALSDNYTANSSFVFKNNKKVLRELKKLLYYKGFDLKA